MIFKIVYGNTSFLFPNDILKESVLNYSNTYNEFLKADVMIASSNESNSNQIFEIRKLVNPQISLISNGIPHKFDNKHQTNFEQLKKYSHEVYQIDEGAVILQSDGNKITNVNWK